MGAVDLYGRMLGRHLVRYLPGQPGLIVLNQLGAGGVVALNDWSNKAPPNGLSVTIGAQSQTDPDALIHTHAKYDTTTFNYVGGLAAYSQGLFVNKDAVARLYDKSAKPVIMGMVGSTLRSGNYQVLWGAAFLGWNVKWVRGYTSTAELRQAAGARRDRHEHVRVDHRHRVSAQDSANFTIVSQSGHDEGRQAGRRARSSAMRRSFPIWSRARSRTRWRKRPSITGRTSARSGCGLLCRPARPTSIVATYVKAFEATLNDPQYQS